MRTKRGRRERRRREGDRERGFSVFIALSEEVILFFLLSFLLLSFF